MTADPFLQLQWLQQHAPVCSCGHQFKLGGLKAVGPLFVCTTCSTVAAVAQGWIDDRLDEFDSTDPSAGTR